MKSKFVCFSVFKVGQVACLMGGFILKRRKKVTTPSLTFAKGIKDGIPICMGYLSVSFTFGMMATQGGLPVWVAVLISMTNMTSAGQFAGMALILSGGSYFELAITTLIINLRYMFMSLSLSQKLDPLMKTLERCAISFGNTDEIFAVAMQQEGKVNGAYFSGLMGMPYLGWSIGTLVGATATGLLPLSLRTALGIAIYGMFLAIIIPPARKLKPVLYTVLISVFLSCVFRWTPVLNQVSSGWVIILCAVVASTVMALRYPVDTEEEEKTPVEVTE